MFSMEKKPNCRFGDEIKKIDTKNIGQLVNIALDSTND